MRPHPGPSGSEDCLATGPGSLEDVEVLEEGGGVLNRLTGLREMRDERDIHERERGERENEIECMSVWQG